MSLKVLLSYNEKTIEITPEQTFFEALYVDYHTEETEQYKRIRLMLHPKEGILLKDLKIIKSREFQIHEKIFCNGFQSASESREYHIDEHLPRLKPYFTERFRYNGDHHRKAIPRGKGRFHSWTYGFIRSAGQIDFVGSLTEATAFTIIQYDVKNQAIYIRKDCEGLQLDHSFPILDLVFLKGKDKEVFENYFQLMKLKPPKTQPLTGWCGRNPYSNPLTEEIISNNVKALVEKGCSIDVIHIEDGYQSKAGDWLTFSKDFPNGVSKLCRKIKENGFKAGIWIAPFICEEGSDLHKSKAKWLVKDDKGNPLRAGYHPNWKNGYYVLDFYHPEVRKYLTGIFYTFLNKWNFDLIKMDLLFAVCIKPPANKTRGQLMSDALHFLKSLTKEKLSFACSVPYGSAFGLFDFCQVSADTGHQWESRYLKWLNYRERTSAIASLRSTLHRWQLDGKAFYNAPSPFILADKSNRLTPNQQYSMLLIGTLLGSFQSVSDLVDRYSEEQWAELQSIHTWRESRISKVEHHRGDLYKIHFEKDRQHWLAICNLNGKKNTISHRDSQFELEPYESIVLSN